MPENGPGSTYHYLGAEPRSRGGWESIGDLGYYDEDGYLYLSDRSTDCIVSGGANVYPAEVEGALGAHPGVRTSAVIGLPDDDLGQKVVAIVEAEPGVTAEELDAHLRELVAPYKRPREYELTDQNLRDEAGKVRRSALRKARLETAVSELASSPSGTATAAPVPAPGSTRPPGGTTAPASTGSTSCCGRWPSSASATWSSPRRAPSGRRGGCSAGRSWPSRRSPRR